MHSTLRPLVRTRLFPLACGALIAALALSLGLGLRATAQDADRVVARVNGNDIKASDVAIAEEDIGANLAQMPPESRREYLTAYLTDMALVANAAEGRKLGESDEFKQRIREYAALVALGHGKRQNISGAASTEFPTPNHFRSRLGYIVRGRALVHGRTVAIFSKKHKPKKLKVKIVQSETFFTAHISGLKRGKLRFKLRAKALGTSIDPSNPAGAVTTQFSPSRKH